MNQSCILALHCLSPIYPLTGTIPALIPPLPCNDSYFETNIWSSGPGPTYGHMTCVVTLVPHLVWCPAVSVWKLFFYKSPTFTFFSGPHKLCSWSCSGLVLLNLFEVFNTAHHPLGILLELLDTTVSCPLLPLFWLFPLLFLLSRLVLSPSGFMLSSGVIQLPVFGTFKLLQLLRVTKPKAMVLTAASECFPSAKHELYVSFHLVLKYFILQMNFSQA